MAAKRRKRLTGPDTEGRIEDENQLELWLPRRRGRRPKPKQPKQPKVSRQLAYFCDTYTERFWSYVELGGPDECWLWQRGKTNDGYGQIAILGVPITAHRYAKEMQLGERISPELEASHTCHNRGCVNPAHVVVETHLDNMARKPRKPPKGRKRKPPQSKVRGRRPVYTAEERIEVRNRRQREYYHGLPDDKREEVRRKARERYHANRPPGPPRQKYVTAEEKREADNRRQRERYHARKLVDPDHHNKRSRDYYLRKRDGGPVRPRGRPRKVHTDDGCVMGAE